MKKHRIDCMDAQLLFACKVKSLWYNLHLGVQNEETSENLRTVVSQNELSPLVQ